MEKQQEEIRGTEKEFLDIFKTLSYSRSSWQVWADVISAIACSLSLLPQDQQEPLWRSIREAGAASRKRGFMEGYRSACSMITDMEAGYGK